MPLSVRNVACCYCSGDAAQSRAASGTPPSANPSSRSGRASNMRRRLRPSRPRTSGSASARRRRASSFPERTSRPRRRALADDLFRGLPSSTGRRRLSRMEFRPVRAMGGLRFQRLPEGMTEAEVATPPYIRMEDNFTWWALGATIAFDGRYELGARPLRRAGGEGRHQILLGARASAAKSPISTTPVASPRSSLSSAP